MAAQQGSPGGPHATAGADLDADPAETGHQQPGQHAADDQDQRRRVAPPGDLGQRRQPQVGQQERHAQPTQTGHDGGDQQPLQHPDQLPPAAVPVEIEIGGRDRPVQRVGQAVLVGAGRRLHRLRPAAAQPAARLVGQGPDGGVGPGLLHTGRLRQGAPADRCRVDLLATALATAGHGPDGAGGAGPGAAWPARPAPASRWPARHGGARRLPTASTTAGTPAASARATLRRSMPDRTGRPSPPYPTPPPARPPPGSRRRPAGGAAAFLSATCRARWARSSATP